MSYTEHMFISLLTFEINIYLNFTLIWFLKRFYFKIVCFSSKQINIATHVKNSSDIFTTFGHLLDTKGRDNYGI